MAHSKRCKRRRLRRAKTGMYRQRASGGAKASGARAQSAARARQTPRGGVAGRREVSRPSHASRIRGWMQRAGPKAVARWRSETQPRNAVAPVPTVADNAPTSLSLAHRCVSRRARTARQSLDCLRVRSLSDPRLCAIHELIGRGARRGGGGTRRSERRRRDAQDAANALARRDGRYSDQATRCAGAAGLRALRRMRAR